MGVSRFWRAGLVVALSDQLAIAVVNLAFNLVLVRVATPAEFGGYGLAYAVLMLAAGAGNALFVNQMTVLASPAAPAPRQRLVAGFLRLQAVLALAAAVAVLAWGLAVQSLAPAGAAPLPLLAGLALAMSGWLLFEFARRVSYLPGAMTRRGLLAGLLLVGVSGAGLWALLERRPPQPHALALGLLAVAGLAAALPTLAPIVRDATADAARAAWSTAGSGPWWALAAMAPNWVHTFAYAYLLAWFVDTAAVATANAARILVMPPMVLLTAAGLVALPRLAARFAAGDAAGAVRWAALLFGAVFAIAAGYLALLGIFHTPIAAALLGAEYAAIGAATAAWGAALLLLVPRAALSALTQARRRFRTLTFASAIAAAAGVALGLATIPRFGVPAAILCVAAAEAILVALLLLALRRPAEPHG